MRRTATSALISAMKILSQDKQFEDRVANATISESADRLEEFTKYREFYDFVSYVIAERREKCQGRVFYDAVKNYWQKYQRREE